MAVRQEESPAPLAVESGEVVHDHPGVLCDAAAKHTHRETQRTASAIFGLQIFYFNTDN